MPRVDELVLKEESLIPGLEIADVPIKDVLVKVNGSVLVDFALRSLEPEAPKGAETEEGAQAVPDATIWNVLAVENIGAVEETNELVGLVAAALAVEKMETIWLPEPEAFEAKLADNLGFKGPLFRLEFTGASKANIDEPAELEKSGETGLPNVLNFNSSPALRILSLNKSESSSWVAVKVLLQQPQKTESLKLLNSTHKSTKV